MKGKKLKNAPLQEAIFELFWQSPLDATGFPFDKDFEFALGKFDSHISTHFPIKKKIVPDAPGLRVYGRPMYQFWTQNAVWPVVQLGPGILTVNDTDKNYEWEATYRPNILTAIDALIKNYDQKPQFSKVSLKYIDSVDIDSFEDIHDFISQNFQTGLVNRFDIPGRTIGLNINQAFEIDESTVLLNIQTAKNNSNGKKALVWMTTVEKTGKFTDHDIRKWLDHAHSLSSDLFVKMLNPDFYASFNK